MDTKHVIEYYDGYIIEQLKSGINDRIYQLFKRLLHCGLKPDSNILELGSGIGTMTFLLSKHVNKGKIEAVDISPESIAFSKQKIKRSNISFFANDIVTHIPSIQNIDFITLFDVIEHIPIDKHDTLFQNIATICNDRTKILINIPNPDYVDYDKEHHPEVLQIVDQPLPLTLIMKSLERNGLSLTYFETYSIWVENDYQFFVITPTKPFKEIKLSSKRNFFQKALKKVERIYIKMRYNYR